QSHHAQGQVHDCRACRDIAAVGLCADEFRWNPKGQLEPQAPKQTRSFSSSRRATTAGGRSPATAFPPPIRCKADDAMDPLAGACSDLAPFVQNANDNFQSGEHGTNG